MFFYLENFDMTFNQKVELKKTSSDKNKRYFFSPKHILQEDIFGDLKAYIINVHEPGTCLKNESFSSVLEE